MIVWQWYNYVVSCIPTGKTVLRINIDETAICVHQQSPRGVLCVNRNVARELLHHVPRATRRRYITYVSMICDNEDLQAVLPQYLIGNEATFRQCDMTQLQEGLPRNIHLLRRKSAWCDSKVMVLLLRQLHLAISRHIEGLQPIILWDAAKHHTTPMVYASAKRMGFWPITIPAKLTWLLQPLDTHVFASFKRRLEDAHHAARVRDARGEVAFPHFMQCVYSTIDAAISKRSWHDAFDGDGFNASQLGLSTRIKNQLRIKGPARVPEGQPSLDDVAQCFPKRFRLTHGMAFGAATQPILRRSRALADRPVPVGIRLHPSPPLRMRTRSGIRALHRCASIPRRSLRLLSVVRRTEVTSE